MPFPFVAVTLPPDTPPAYSAVLIEACSHAYSVGDCRLNAATAVPPSQATAADGPKATSQPKSVTPSPPQAPPAASSAPIPPTAAVVQPPPPPGADSSQAAPLNAPAVAKHSNGDDTISGMVVWVDDHTAELQLGLTHWRNNRWLERELTFKDGDEPLERHRAVGFALGSLAGTVAEVARLERESHDHEQPTSTPSPPPEAGEAQAVPPPAAPPEPVRPSPTFSPSPDSAPWLAPQLWLAFDAGSGFAQPRLGAMAGLGLRFDPPWTIKLTVRYARETVSEQLVVADYANVGLGAAARFAVGWLEVHAGLGGAMDMIWVRSSAAGGKRVARPEWWGTGELTFLPRRPLVAPFLTVGGALVRPLDTDIDGLSYGPWHWYSQLGLSIRFDAR